MLSGYAPRPNIYASKYLRVRVMRSHLSIIICTHISTASTLLSTSLLHGTSLSEGRDLTGNHKLDTYLRG
jgi:hypothetical protein